MEDPRFLKIDDYHYELPEARIAHYPLPNRDDSKLLIYNKGVLNEAVYGNLPVLLPENSLLVFNDTKVVEARMVFTKASGSRIELFCLQPDERYNSLTAGLLQKGKVYWICMAGGAKKWKEDILEKTIETADSKVLLSAKKIERRGDDFLVEFNWSDTSLSFAAVLHLAGFIPLPPYMNRSAELSDKERYQTIYATHNGSVAAPTAGLHFTEQLFCQLEAQHIKKDFVTLHVGAGTFKPVKAAVMEGHDMHAEFFEVKRTLVENLLHHESAAIAVGTTSLRAMESLYWMGVKIGHNPALALEALPVQQWEPYELAARATPVFGEALQALLQWMDAHKLEKLMTKTSILIAPGYQLKTAKALLTNFHQPRSTLLLLVAAIAGSNWRKIYRYALEHDFRFLSYGDGCLLFA